MAIIQQGWWQPTADNDGPLIMTDHAGQWGQIKGSIWPRPVRKSVTGVRGQILWSLYSKSSIATQNPKLMQSVQIDRRQEPGAKSPSRSDLIVKSNAHWSGETSMTGEGNWQLIFQDTSLTSDTWTSVTVEINLCDYLLGTWGASLIHGHLNMFSMESLCPLQAPVQFHRFRGTQLNIDKTTMNCHHVIQFPEYYQ